MLKNIRIKAIIVLTFAFVCASFANAQITRINPSGSGIKPIQTPASNGKIKTIEPQKNAPPEISKENVEETAHVGSLPKQPLRDWVVMLFLSTRGDDCAGMDELYKLEAVGSTDKVAYVAQIARTEDGAQYTSGEKWSGTRRYLIEKSPHPLNFPDRVKDDAKLASPAIFAHSESMDMGDYKNVVQFVKWAKKNFPAKKYMFIMVGHGSGWRDSRPEPQHNFKKGIAYDAYSENFIRTQDLTKMFKAMGKIDLFAAMACLTQMMEVVYQLRGAVPYVIGSQEQFPMKGFYYKEFARALNDNPSMSAVEAGKNLIEGTRQFYLKHEFDAVFFTTLSLLDISKMPNLINSLNEWTDIVMNVPQDEIKPVLAYAKDKVLRFESMTYADLGMFISLVANKSDNKEIKQSSQKVIAALRSVVLAKASQKGMKNNDGVAYSKAQGIAISVPHKPFLGQDENYFNVYDELPYKEYPFAKHTNWGKFYYWMTDLFMGPYS